ARPGASLVRADSDGAALVSCRVRQPLHHLAHLGDQTVIPGHDADDKRAQDDGCPNHPLESRLSALQSVHVLPPMTFSPPYARRLIRTPAAWCPRRAAP